MNAPQSEDDHNEDAVKRAQRAHEPSMEEILASIRAIIADDKAKATASRPAPAAGSQVIYSNFGQKAAEAQTPTVVWSRPDEGEAADGELPPAEPPEPEAELTEAEPLEAPLLSVDADREVAASFQALSVSLAAPDPKRVEEMTRELLRPMLKTWLDENLPSIVERLVKSEIQRVARGGR
jgi:uncharacterized protein